MGTFVQIIEYTTSRADEVRALGEKFRANPPAGVGPRRVMVAEDRDRPGHFLNIVEFDDYETAMKNSDAPETQEFAAAMTQLVDGPPTFYNLDVLDSWER